MYLRLLLLIVFIFTFFGSGSAQTKRITAYTHAIYDSTDQKVKIRWAPGDVYSFDHYIGSSYTLLRYTFFNGVDTLTDSVYQSSRLIIDSNIVYLPEQAWDSLSADTNAIGFAMAAIFDEEMEVELISGSPLVQAHSLQKALETRFNFGLMAADRSFSVAKAMGLGYEIEEQNSGYIYRYVAMPNSIPDSTAIKVLSAQVTVGSSPELPMPTFVDGIGQDKKILLEWSLPDDAAVYTGYFLERSDNGGSSFTAVNDLPAMSASETQFNSLIHFYGDTVDLNEATYIYKVRGIDIFERLGPWSDTIHIYCKPPYLEAAPYIIDHTINTSGYVELNWTFPSDKQNLITKFTIRRATKENGEFTILEDNVSVSDSSYTDETPLKTGYYRVVAHDKNEREVASYSHLVQFEDNTPPDAPANVYGSCDASGNINVNWTAPEDEDVLSYRVFFTYNIDADWIEATKTPIKDALFVFNNDLNTLNKKVFVQVQAIDNRANYSDFSTTAEVILYDAVPPTPPVLLLVSQQPFGFKLNFSRSLSEDVATHRIERRPGSEGTWTILKTISIWESDDFFDVQDSLHAFFIDSTELPSMPYAFRIVAVDSFGNQRSSDIRYFDPQQIGNRGDISGENVSSFNASPGKMARLGWNYSHQGDVEKYTIYRSINNFAYNAYRSVEGTSQEVSQEWPGMTIPSGSGTYLFVDHVCTSDNKLPGTNVTVTKVRYKIMARHYDGTVSTVSPEVQINY
jgi:hypothetical protein